jgi:hypothetical protein
MTRRKALTTWATFTAFCAGIASLLVAIIGTAAILGWVDLDSTGRDFVGVATILAVGAWSTTAALVVARGGE